MSANVPLTASVWINGRAGRWIEVSDRGFQYGDGLFETFLIQDHKPRLWEAHLARLRRGCERLALPMPDPALLYDEALRACAGVEAGVLKLQLTRGSGGRGYAPPDEVAVTRVFSRHALPPALSAWRRDGVRVRLCRTRLGINPALAGIKHCNRLEQVLARLEWRDPGIGEGLMCDSEGFLVEGTMSNVFWARGSVAFTPRIDRCGVAGIVRDWVMRQLQAWGMTVSEVRVKPALLAQAEEVFLTNSVIGIVPVVAWDDRRWPVGALTRRLQEAWQS